MRESEDEHQASLFRWSELMTRQYPELRLMFHPPNGGLRTQRTAAKLRRQGVKPGVPDVVLPVPRHGFHGLFLELKRPGPHSTSPAQRAYVQALNEQGYLALVVVGWEAARDLITRYLGAAQWQD